MTAGSAAARASRAPTDDLSAVRPTLAAATLMALPRMRPDRLRALADRWPDPVAALRAVRQGRAAPALLHADGPRSDAGRRRLAAEWAAAADHRSAARVLARRSTRVLLEGRLGYPVTDPLPDRPPYLLAEGDGSEAFDRPRVAVVGTRAATPHGLSDARRLGEALAEAGATVVSGLAIGIDAAAHEGALAAGGPAVGVVATGPDVVYPRRHVRLFDLVRSSGLIVSEAWFGTPPEPFRFPIRNRIIAALADAVVVVEAKVTGGTRSTAEHALAYGRDVWAQPGSIRNPAAAGCNQLVAEGAHPLLDHSELVESLRLRPVPARAAPPPVPLGHPGRVLAACGGEAATTEELVSRTGLSPAEVASAAAALQRSGHLSRSRGAWWPE